MYSIGISLSVSVTFCTIDSGFPYVGHVGLKLHNMTLLSESNTWSLEWIGTESQDMSQFTRACRHYIVNLNPRKYRWKSNNSNYQHFPLQHLCT